MKPRLLLSLALILIAVNVNALDFKPAGGGGSGTTVNNKTCAAGSAFTDFTAPDFTCTAGTSGAPSTATYITQTPDAGLSAEQPLSVLGSGAMLNTTATGVVSIYAGSGACGADNFITQLDASIGKTCGTSSITLNGSAIALGGTRTLSLASADFANQGTTTTVLHGNAAGNPSFGAVVTNDITDANVTYAKIQNGGALSVAGRSANSAGVMADISASAASGAVLRESGSTIGFGTVATAGIADAAVTYAKVQNVTDARLLGRNAGSAGAPQEITLGTGLSFSGTTLNSSGGSDPWTTLTASADSTTTGLGAGVFMDVTGISFTAAANTNYLMHCYLIVSTHTTGNGIHLAWNTPASPTDIFGEYWHATTTGAVAQIGSTIADDTIDFNTTAWPAIDGKKLVRFDTLFRNGANSGTTQLRLASELASGTSTATVYQNSVCQYRSI